MISAVQSARRISNHEIYRHVPTAKIVELFDSGLSDRKIGKLLGMGPGAVKNRLRKEGKHRECPRVTPEELKVCRLDPAWEARHGIANRVVCRECGEFKALMNANGEHSHLRKHRMTLEDYSDRYPGARLSGFDRAATQSARNGRNHTAEQLMQWFAARYLTAEQLVDCRADRDWEERHGFDFVACRRCGLKSRTDLHAHACRHGYLGIKDYRADYPKAPWIPLCVRHGYRMQYDKDRYAQKKAQTQENAERLAEAERRAANLRQELEKQEAIVEKLKGKLGRPRTREEDAARYGPRIKELRADGKSWGQVTRIMNQETGESRSVSGWRHLIEDSAASST